MNILKTVTETSVKSLVLAIIICFFEVFFRVDSVSKFAQENLLGLLVICLPINAVAIDFIVIKMQKICERHYKAIDDVFPETKKQISLSIKEQIILIIVALVLSLFPFVGEYWEWVKGLVEILSLAILGYLLFIMLDTAKAVWECI